MLFSNQIKNEPEPANPNSKQGNSPMPRYARMIIPDEKAVYHVMSRTALDGFPFGDLEKDEFVRILRLFSNIYFTEILGFSILGNNILCGATHKEFYVQ